MNDLAQIFKALADETRLQMLALLLERGELCVCDLMGTLGTTQSKASRHLRYLLHAGLLRDRREGVWVYYRIAEPVDADRAVLLEAVRGLTAGERLQSLLRALEGWLTQKNREGACRAASCTVEPTTSTAPGPAGEPGGRG